eukprot:1160786-Pelagomonas_calceolata.AAC.4
MPRCTQDHRRPTKRTASDTMNSHTPFSRFFFWSCSVQEGREGTLCKPIESTCVALEGLLAAELQQVMCCVGSADKLLKCETFINTCPSSQLRHLWHLRWNPPGRSLSLQTYSYECKSKV